MHVDIDSHGKYKPKTIGKMMDQYNIIEGSFTCVFQSIIVESQSKFITINDGHHMAKTPMGCFEECYIDNDMNEIINTLENYYQGN